MIKGYFQVYSQPYKNITYHKQVVNAILLYQLFDVILTIVDAIAYNVQDNRIVLISRIIVQLVTCVLFYFLMNYLRKLRSGFINVATFLQLLSLIILWTETDCYINYNTNPSYTAETYTIMIALTISLESNICQTGALLFHVLYSLIRQSMQLFRIKSFTNKLEIFSSIRIILIHITFQLFLYQLPQYKHKLNNHLVMLGQQNKYFTPVNTNRQSLNPQSYRQTTNLNQDYEKIRLQTNNNDIVSEENRFDSKNLDQFYENVINNIQLGTFIIDNIQSSVKTINSFFSHLVLRDDQLSDDFLNLELHNFGMAFEETFMILPKFNRSKDIGNFTKFIQLLDITYENGNNGLRELQFFHKNMKLKTLFQHLLPFLHFKFIQCQMLIDFALKIYLKKDNQFMSVVLSPILYHHKPQLILFLSDLSEEPLITQLNQYNQNSDQLISDISQKIKQPLNCTISMLEITIVNFQAIQHSVPFEIQEKYLIPALAGCKLLISTANDILDYVAIRKKGKLDLCQMDVYIRYFFIQDSEFINDVLNIIKQQALFRGLQLQINIRHNVPAFLRTDPNRLRQIILNLLVTSIQATINGTIMVSASKSLLMQDHIELTIQVKATEINQSVLKTIEKTVRFFKSQNLLTQNLIDLTNAGRKFSQSILIAFCLSLSISTLPFEYYYEKGLEDETFRFILQIQNKNPNFTQQLNFKRQSALSIQQQSVRQSFSMDQGFRRHQSSRISLLDKAMKATQNQQLDRIAQKQSILKLSKSQSQKKDVDTRKMSTSFGYQSRSKFIVPRTSQGDTDIDFVPTFKTIKSQDQSRYKIKQINSNSKSDISIVSEAESKDSKGSSHNSLDVGVQLDQFIYKQQKSNIDPVDPSLVMQQSIGYTYNNNISPSHRDSILTFGGKSSMYSSMRYSASIMQPNDLIDCFEKMERIKQQKFTQNCQVLKTYNQCPRILICEQNDFDLYAVSHQLGNIGINFDYTIQRIQIGDKLARSFEVEQQCCKGYQIILLSVEFVDEELTEICNKIKEIAMQFKKDTRLIGLIGFHDEENRSAIKNLPFHDYLSKPLMIEALLFILAKWMKL